MDITGEFVLKLRQVSLYVNILLWFSLICDITLYLA
jgi:hypothetical protein